MELYAKGQLSYLILTCMLERDFYGLDIISEISNRSNGRINLKKPSVYSNLTRMEKQGYISSYLKNSDFGPNRKYYSLTEKGRNFYSELKSYFDNNNIDVFRDFEDSETKEDVKEQETTPISPISDSENNDFFDFSSLKAEKVDESATLQDNKEDPVDNEEVIEKAEIEDSLEIKENKQEELQDVVEEVKEEPEEVKNDAVFLSQETVDEYNKRLYDISKDINKIKRKRSFADDQIAMTATEPLYISNEKIKANVEEFKNSFIENREKYSENRTSSYNHFKQKEERTTLSSLLKKEEKQEEIKNDAKFITEYLDPSKIERAKKIEPPRLNIIVENNKDSKLPAPNRDKSIDPSHKEILNQLYAKTKDGNAVESRKDAIYDYNDLKDYYKTQGIDFNVYQKSMEKVKHNTNKLNLIHSLLVFLMVAVVSTTLFLVFNFVGLTNESTNFLYILLPALLLIDTGYCLYNYKNFSSWIPSKIRPQWQIWLTYILLSGFVVGLNFAFGMAVKSFDLFTTSLVLPLVLLVFVLPIRYYLKRFILVKYWK